MGDDEPRSIIRDACDLRDLKSTNLAGHKFVILDKIGNGTMPLTGLEKEADDIEMEAADKAYSSGLGVSEWEAFLTLGQTRRLIELADAGFGTWAREPDRLAGMKEEVRYIESKTD